MIVDGNARSLRLFAKVEGEPEFEITDLYWFEENGVHSLLEGEGHYGTKYAFRFEYNTEALDD